MANFIPGNKKYTVINFMHDFCHIFNAENGL